MGEVVVAAANNIPALFFFIWCVCLRPCVMLGCLSVYFSRVGVSVYFSRVNLSVSHTLPHTLSHTLTLSLHPPAHPLPHPLGGSSDGSSTLGVGSFLAPAPGERRRRRPWRRKRKGAASSAM